MMSYDDLNNENDGEDQTIELSDTESEAEAELSEDIIAEEEPEEGATPFDEEELLALAEREGLGEVISEVQLSDEESSEDESETKSGKKSRRKKKEKPFELTTEQKEDLMAGIETILFMSDKPLPLAKLRSVIDRSLPITAYRTAMAELREEFGQKHRGVEISEVNLGFQLRTKPQMSTVLRKLVQTRPVRLSSAVMEVLSVVAYKQPVTKDDVDQIRGVDCGYVVRSLMERRLVRIVGRSELPGRPLLYGTTHEFLELFSLNNLESLPAMHEVESMVAESEVGEENQRKEALNQFTEMIQTEGMKPLFDDSQIDEELQSLREEIRSIPTSTEFLDDQKAEEKAVAHFNDAIEQLEQEAMQAVAEGKTELEIAAAKAEKERHAEMIEEAIQETSADLSEESIDLPPEVANEEVPSSYDEAPIEN